MSAYKHIKIFEDFVAGNVGGKRNPKWKFFSNRAKNMVPAPEVIVSPEDDETEILSWGSTVDPSMKYGVAISSPSSEFPEEQITFWLEDPYLLKEIEMWWRKRGYKMIPGEVPSSGDDPEKTPRVYINFEKADQVVRDLGSFFEKFPL